MKSLPFRVAIRADVSSQIGFGHFKRCLSLAQALVGFGVESLMVSRDLGIAAKKMADGAGIHCTVLPVPASSSSTDDFVPYASWGEVNWELDARQTISSLADFHPNWVIIDHYAFDARWHRAVCAALAARIAVIDDLADRDLEADLVIDPNLSEDPRKKYAGRLVKTCKLLCGPRFALLAEPFARSEPIKIHDDVASLGIFMGGVDRHDLTGLALRACREFGGFAGPIEIVTTRANPHADRLSTLVHRTSNTKISFDLPDLASFFARHDLQIGAGGTASWERCVLGVPSIALMAAENQNAVLPALSKAGAVLLVETLGAIDPAAIARATQSLVTDFARRAEMALRSRELVDGLGAKRIALFLTSPLLRVRSATMIDSEMIAEWRNHPSTRQVSVNQEPIATKSHYAWLESVLRSAERCLLIAEVGCTPVGVIRFDRAHETRVDVSLYLDPRLHGLGLGPAMLRAGERYILNKWSHIEQFVARVLPGNLASSRLFQGCNYHPTGEFWQKTLMLSRQSEDNPDENC